MRRGRWPSLVRAQPRSKVRTASPLHPFRRKRFRVSSSSHWDAERSPRLPREPHLESHSAAVSEREPARPGRRGSIAARQEAHLPGGGGEPAGAVPRTRGCGRARSVGETDSMPVAHADPHRRRPMTGDDNGDLGPERRPAPRIGLPAVPRVPVQPDMDSQHRPRTPPGVHAIGDRSRTADAEGRIGAGARGAGRGIARSAPAVVTTRARREGARHQHAQDQSRHPPHRGVLRAASR